MSERAVVGGPLPVERLPLQLDPDPRRVLLRPFLPSLVVKATGSQSQVERLECLMRRLAALDQATCEAELDRLRHRFGVRHRTLERMARQRWLDVLAPLCPQQSLSAEQQLLLGYYLTHEYALESAALFNPSLVPHPVQGGLPPGSLRVVLSLRATGEGHISSIEFRGGVISADGQLRLDAVSPFVFQGDIHSLNGGEDHYEVTYSPESLLSERVLFPVAARESNGLEDARFVRLEGEEPRYLATATAYDGRGIHSQLIETNDFRHFVLRPLRGSAIRNKGLAFFPRRIGGAWWMLGRQDSENIHLMSSDQSECWHHSQVLLRPQEPWEFIQLGNCGSPLETEAGWLVLTHGVGPVREYCIGAALLDRQDPARVIGRLRHPLLRAADDERDGYVPNVVYSCGGLIHADHLWLPYAVSDRATRLARVALTPLLDALLHSPPRDAVA
ncbi:MAG: glycoside hydrolase family 130 protein [Cyanobacteriota bacterium]|nr:glycoside hydrolase family 130 protein [Cyanobacteriota bacterium]